MKTKHCMYGYHKGKFIRDEELAEQHFIKDKSSKSILRWGKKE